ncbi:hypothetical protein [Corallococcus aberystwythensis]|uniref:Uncharacterized protein n=1 Tax=Corallococcus aberystwythensis TaxID=2316722 RepID=A0A3A8PN01_9BACT|nr:hypothetical protein [Corallococcus aberystwythensis]RKH57499.1 hypothetical protein D7W81_31115 [Corallococcus aberystwythensis]
MMPIARASSPAVSAQPIPREPTPAYEQRSTPAPARTPGYSSESRFEDARATPVALDLQSLPGAAWVNRSIESYNRVQDMRGTGVQPRSAFPFFGPSRQAELRTVPPERQADVNAGVRGMLTEQLSRLRPEDQARLRPLVDAVGTSGFYERVAELDTGNAGAWRQMAGVQQSFAAGEANESPTTRAYSESMRLTLHATAVLQFAGATGRVLPRNEHTQFIRNHATAFHENGGSFTNLPIGVSGAFKVLRNTPLSMAQHLPSLLGAAVDPMGDRDTRTAAEMVRRSRAQVIDGR